MVKNIFLHLKEWGRKIKTGLSIASTGLSVVSTGLILVLLIFVYTDAGTPHAAKYLKQGVGARQIAMGNAAIAVGEDATSAYWNPATLIIIGKKEISVMHSMLSLDREQLYVGYAQPVGMLGGNRALGISLIRSGIEKLREIIKEGETIDVEIGEFKSKELALFISYALKYQPNLSFGANLKYLDQEFVGLQKPKRKGDSAYGISLDLGTLWRPHKNIMLALVLQDIASSLRWDTGREESIPVCIKLGGAYRGYLLRYKPLIIALDLEWQKGDDRIRPHLGVELSQLFNIFSLRCGLNDSFPTVGCGIHFSYSNLNLRLDYSFGPDTFSAWEELKDKYNHRLGVSLRF